jgi:hypothetical protein
MKIITKIVWKLHGSPRCAVCNRPLTNKKDRATGIGAACRRKLGPAAVQTVTEEKQ